MIQRQQLTKPAKANFTTDCAPETQDTSGPLEVVVLFTDVQGTLRALKTAAELARNLNGRIRLLAPQVVPYPLSLDHPQVSNDFNQKRFQTLAANGSAPVGIDTRVEMCWCRDRDTALCQALEPEALVVVGARRSWWPSHEKNLATKLRRKGHHVILVNSERAK